MSDTCSLDCQLKDDVAEIKSDVKKLLAGYNERRGATKVLKAIGAFVAACAALVGVYFKFQD